MRERILEGPVAALVADERARLRDLAGLLQRLGTGAEERETLEKSVAQLDELFLLVVVGEFNAGKSTFVNALLGAPTLEVGPTPTTQRVHRIHHGSAKEPRTGPGGIIEVWAEVELLRDLVIIDTPGTNSLDRDHEALTRELVPRSDLVLFVTSADRPFSESERAFLEEIRGWGKKLVFVLNKADILTSAEELAKVEAYVATNAEKLVGERCPVFAVAARLALEARVGTATLPDASGFPALEAYLRETLDDAERLRLKLANPVGVATRLVARYSIVLEERLRLLSDDVEALDEIERVLSLYTEDLRREFRFRLADVDNLLHELVTRGHAFFDDTLRVARLLDLLNKSRLQRDFQAKVLADIPQRVESKVGELIDWLVESELRQWQAIEAQLEQRRSANPNHAVGSLGRFDLGRERLLDTVGRAAHRALEGFDRERESQRLAESVQTAVAGTALVEVGAIGLGTAVTALATTQFADMTGLLAAGTMAVLGLFILPARRGRAKLELSEKVEKLRLELVAAITEQFEREVEVSVQRIRDSVAPYTRFVRAESQSLHESRDQLRWLAGEFEGIRSRIEAL